MGLYCKAMNFAPSAKNLKARHAACFPWLERGVLCLAVLLAYAGVWTNEFVFDDKELIVFNKFLKHWSNLPQLLTSLNYTGYFGVPRGFYRPVQMLIYFFIYQAFGLSTVAFHALNIVQQALNACLLHLFGLRVGFRKGVAFAAALLWAVHPLHTDNIAGMASTAEPLWCCFSLMGLIALLPDFAPRKMVQALVFFLLALGSKETAVVFPALAVITLFFVSKERTKAAVYLKTWPLWLLSAGYMAAYLGYAHISGYNLDVTADPAHAQDYTYNLTNRLLTCLATLPIYAGMIVLPTGLHILRNFPVFPTLLAWQPAVGALMVALALLQIFRIRRGLALSFGLLWFAVALSPYTGIIFPIDALLCESWLYMPTMGLFLGVAQTAAGFFEKRQNAARGLVLVLALSLGIATFVQNKTWRDTETLYQNVIQHDGNVDRLSDYLALFYMERGEFGKARGQLEYIRDTLQPKRKVGDLHLQLAMAWLQVRMDETQAVELTSIAQALPSCQHIPEVIAELGKSLQENPDFTWAHQALVVIYAYQGNTQMADFHLKRAHEILQKQGIQ
jgi:hypothetical protein